MVKAPQASTRADLIALAAIVLSGVLLCGLMAFHLADSIGRWTDDAIYLVNAKSLAEGQGYRHLHLPGMPWQTKYPPLYPLALSVLWRMFGSLDSVADAAHMLNGVLWTMAGVAAYTIARRQWKVPVWVAGAGAVLGVLELQSLDVLASTMSEALFTVLAIAAVGCAGIRRAPVDPSHAPVKAGDHWAWALAAGVLAGLSVLTRSIGIACAGACFAAFVLTRRWKSAAVCGAALAIIVGGFMVWRSALAARNAGIPAAAAYAYDLDYSHWMQLHASGTLRVAWLNSGDMLLSVTQRIAPWPGSWVTWSIEEGWLTQSIYLAWCGLVCGVTAVGLAVSWKRGGPAVALYVAGSMLLMLIWPFQPARFVTPLVPLLSIAFLLGAWTSIEWTARQVMTLVLEGSGDSIRTRASRSGALMASRVVSTLAVLLLGQVALVYFTVYTSTPSTDYVTARNAGLDVIKERTPSDAVIAGWSPAIVYLYCARQGIPIAPADDPVAQHYAATRSWRMMGTDGAHTDEAYFRELFMKRLEPYYNLAGVTFALVPPANTAQGDTRSMLLLEYFRGQPARFRQVSKAGAFWLYEYTNPRIGG